MIEIIRMKGNKLYRAVELYSNYIIFVYKKFVGPNEQQENNKKKKKMK